LGAHLGDVAPCSASDREKELTHTPVGGGKYQEVNWKWGLRADNRDPNKRGGWAPDGRMFNHTKGGADGWDWAAQYVPGNFMHNYIDRGCGATSQHLNFASWKIYEKYNKYTHNAKTTDDWKSWGGVYPHTAPNLVGYGADGLWGSEKNKYSTRNNPHLYPQNTFFHPMSPLSIMGVKTYKDIQDDTGLGDGFEKDTTSVVNDQGDVFDGSNYDPKWRPRHVQTSMTRCDHPTDGKFPELMRNKLFFDTDQTQTSLYPSELASQTVNTSNFINNKTDVIPAWKNAGDLQDPKNNPAARINKKIKGERPNVASGGILRGCMRRQQDYDAANILHCCIVGEPLDGESYNKNRKQIAGTDQKNSQYTCPSGYCRNIKFVSDLTSQQINVQKLDKEGTRACAVAGGPSIKDADGDDKPYCHQMSKKCSDFGQSVCGNISPGNDILESLCKAYGIIQPKKYKPIIADQCTWFLSSGGAGLSGEIKSVLQKKYTDLDSDDIIILKKLYRTLNSKSCQRTLRHMSDDKTLNLQSMCDKTVEEGYGKCLPTPNPSPTRTEIDQCNNTKDDPVECNKEPGCQFQHINPETDSEYTKEDYLKDKNGIKRYWRKTTKGAILSYNIQPHDNKLEGEELIEKLRNSGIHRTIGEEGIGADICGCHYDEKGTNDYDKWYKENKAFAADPENGANIRAGQKKVCWMDQCMANPFTSRNLQKKSGCDATIMNCIQTSITNIEIAGGQGLTRIKSNADGAQNCLMNADSTEINVDSDTDNANVSQDSSGNMDPDDDDDDDGDDESGGTVGTINSAIQRKTDKIDKATDEISGGETSSEKKNRIIKEKSSSNTTTVAIVIGVIIAVIILIFAIMKLSKK
jgi:hypothetical protein